MTKAKPRRVLDKKRLGDWLAGEQGSGTDLEKGLAALARVTPEFKTFEAVVQLASSFDGNRALRLLLTQIDGVPDRRFQSWAAQKARAIWFDVYVWASPLRQRRPPHERAWFVFHVLWEFLKETNPGVRVSQAAAMRRFIEGNLDPFPKFDPKKHPDAARLLKTTGAYLAIELKRTPFGQTKKELAAHKQVRSPNAHARILKRQVDRFKKQLKTYESQSSTKERARLLDELLEGKRFLLAPEE